jgi:ABC-2 type transport system permease protein
LKERNKEILLMKTLWYIAKKDLLQVLKDRNSFILLLIVPLILITILGVALGNGIEGNSNKATSFTVSINNKDDGFIGDALIKALQAKNNNFNITISKCNNVAQVLQQVNDGKAIVGLVIPARTTKNLRTAASNGLAISNLVQFYMPPNSTDERAMITQQMITNIINRQVNTLYTGSAAVRQVTTAIKQVQQAAVAQCNTTNGAGNTTNHNQYSNNGSTKTDTSDNNPCGSTKSTINAEAISKTVGEASPANTGTPLVEILTTGAAKKVNSFDRSLPGFAILFALFGLNTAAATILQEKDDGTFRRLLIAPVPRYALLGGKLIAQFVLTLLQLTLLFIIGYLIFKLSIGSWPAIALLLITTSFATTGLGMLLVSVVKTRRQLTPVVTLTTLVTSAIGGSWWPLWNEPQWMQQIARIGITAWALDGLNGVMIFGKDFSSVRPDILGLLGYGVLCFLLALCLFRFQEKGA